VVSRDAGFGNPAMRFIHPAQRASLAASLLLAAVLLLSATAPTLARSTGNTGKSGKSGKPGKSGTPGKPTSTKKKKKSPSKQHNEETTPEATSASTPQEGTCFPAGASVTLATGATRRMDELLLGDNVLAAITPRGPVFSPVFMFTHRDPSPVSDFVTLSTSSNTSLSLSPGHYVYLSTSSRAVPASAVRPGDSLTVRAEGCGCGMSARPSVVTSVTKRERVGLYNPQTVHGDIYVDGVRASTYTTAVEPTVAHAVLAPFRAVHSVFGVDVSGGVFENGLPAFLGAVVYQIGWLSLQRGRGDEPIQRPAEGLPLPDGGQFPTSSVQRGGRTVACR
jgi:Hint module